MGKPNPNPSRLTAYELVHQVNNEGAYANIRLPELLAKSKMNTADKGFTTELSYGTLRMQGRHDYIIKKFIDRPFNEIDAKIIDLLRIGTHQITQMRVADHAAVGETVEVAKLVTGESKASYVNAILRKIAADSNDLSELEKLPMIERLAIKYSHPEWIISSFFDQLKDWDAVEELLRINNVPVAPHIVAWPGKSSIAEILEVGGNKLPLGNYSVLSNSLPNDYPAIKDKRAGIQDMGSQLIAEIFFATASEAPQKWLDLCAGPGGKAALLHNLLRTHKPADSFLANEPTPHRTELVARVIPKEKILSLDGRDSESFGEKYDRILIDAPCSGLGALRRRPEARWRRSLNDLKELLPLQRDLIDSAYEMLNPGGIIGFATCSPLLAETKSQILDAKYRHKDLQILDITCYSPAGATGVNPDGSMQLWTHLDGSDSMFMALLQKSSG